MIRDKKYGFLTQINQTKISKEEAVFKLSKVHKLEKMQEITNQRRANLLKDKIKRYQQNDKKWNYKKEQIKQQTIQ